VLIVLSLFFLLVWVIFIKFQWLPWNRTWKVIVATVALVIALVVVGALQYYTPASQTAVVSAHTQHIYPVITGRVDKVFVSGTHAVAAGDKLFSIDPRPFQYVVDEKTAALRLAELELGDAQKLVKKGAAAANVRDRKQAERDQARAQLSSAQYELDNTIVRAPADGSVSLVTLRPGQRVSPRSVALNFISSDETWIAATIKQNGLRLLEPGQQAAVSFMSAPGVIYASKVAQVPRAIVQGQVTPEDAGNPFQALSSTQGGYPVRIEMPSEASQELARAGSLAQVTIFTSEGNPINALAKILQWISTWADYVF
jgi:multidrug resistance efflux pump